MEIKKVRLLFTELDVNTRESSREFISFFLTRDFVSNFRCCFCLAASAFLCPSIILLTSCSIARLVTRKASIRRVQSHKKGPHCCQINLPKRIRSDWGLLSQHLIGLNAPSTLRIRNSKTAFSLWKRIKNVFRPHYFREIWKLRLLLRFVPLMLYLVLFLIGWREAR